MDTLVSKQQVKSRVNYMKKENGELTTTQEETAEVLNHFFRSDWFVFVNEGVYEEAEMPNTALVTELYQT